MDNPKAKKNLPAIYQCNIAQFKVFLYSSFGEKIRFIHSNGLAGRKFIISFHRTLGNRLQSLAYRNT